MLSTTRPLPSRPARAASHAHSPKHTIIRTENHPSDSTTCLEHPEDRDRCSAALQRGAERLRWEGGTGSREDGTQQPAELRLRGAPHPFTVARAAKTISPTRASHGHPHVQLADPRSRPGRQLPTYSKSLCVLSNSSLSRSLSLSLARTPLCDALLLKNFACLSSFISRPHLCFSRQSSGLPSA